MAQKKRITCIRKSDRTDMHERIASVGGVGVDGKRWERTQKEAIDEIKSGKTEFYVEQPPGSRVDVIIAESEAGYEYLRTKGDKEKQNNLLSLSECS